MPFEGQIEKVLVKPGDHVNAGDPLVELDVHELTDKKIHAEKERLQALEQARKDTADGKIVDAQIDTSKAEAAQEDVDLEQKLIDQGTLRAPFEAVVLKGDLEDLVNAKKQQGDVLMDVGQIGTLRGAQGERARYPGRGDHSRRAAGARCRQAHARWLRRQPGDEQLPGPEFSVRHSAHCPIG